MNKYDRLFLFCALQVALSTFQHLLGYFQSTEFIYQSPSQHLLLIHWIFISVSFISNENIPPQVPAPYVFVIQDGGVWIAKDVDVLWNFYHMMLSWLKGVFFKAQFMILILKFFYTCMIEGTIFQSTL